MSTTTTMAVILAVAVMFAVAEGQGPATCASDLVSCAGDLNSTGPVSPGCCTSIERVVRTQLPCLCNLVNNPRALAGINLTQALEIPARCNISGDTSACNNAATPGSSPTGRTPGGSGGGSGGSGVGTIAWSAMPALLFFWAVSTLF